MATLPECYDPESMTFWQMEDVLRGIYKRLYPWDDTAEAGSYDYPTFMEAVKQWAYDEFYIQHFLAKTYLNMWEWAND